jgi:hypothetical protein
MKGFPRSRASRRVCAHPMNAHGRLPCEPTRRQSSAVINEIAITVRAEERVAQLRILWQGGAGTEVSMAMTKPGQHLRVTDETTMALVRRLAEHYDDRTIAAILDTPPPGATPHSPVPAARFGDAARVARRTPPSSCPVRPHRQCRPEVATSTTSPDAPQNQRRSARSSHRPRGYVRPARRRRGTPSDPALPW